MATNSPISSTRLRQICNDACDSTLSITTVYDHTQVLGWNERIINSILNSLSSEIASTEQGHKYKFVVNSTIIQHLSDPRSEGLAENGTQTDGQEHASKEAGVSMGDDTVKKVGRRGMHSASGAWWNNEKDGMWSHKYEGSVAKGMDIVLSIMWIAP